MKNFFRIFIVFIFSINCVFAKLDFPKDPITCRDGVLYFGESQKEVALWGVNYELNLSWTFNTHCAKLGIPLDAEVLKNFYDEDFDDLKRMEVKVVRIHLTPADFTDKDGNLVETEYLKLLDYAIFKCKQQGIYLHLALWNRMGQRYLKDSFAEVWYDPQGQGQMLFDRAPYIFEDMRVKQYQHYIKELLNRKNPHTNLLYKDDATICILELMNEPMIPDRKNFDVPSFEPLLKQYKAWLDSKKLEDNQKNFEQYRYETMLGFLNSSYDVIRQIGAKQPVFWSYNWRNYMARKKDIHKAVLDSKVEGVAFCLYPGQAEVYKKKYFDLSDKDFLPYISDSANGFAEVIDARKNKKAVVVYEFETWCNKSGYLYPAMAKFFRQMGAQMASMWEYDPAFSSENNFCSSHFLNLRASPSKAVSSVLAGRVFRNHSRSEVPNNQKWKAMVDLSNKSATGMASHSDMSAWWSSGSSLVYTNSIPKDIEIKSDYKTVIGVGKSSVVDYSGNGSYYLKIQDNAKKVSLYITPDVEYSEDVVSHNNSKKQRIKYSENKNIMCVWLDGFPKKFFLKNLKTGEEKKCSADSFEISAGEYSIRPDNDSI